MSDKQDNDEIVVTPEIAQAISAGCDAFAGFLERLIAGDVGELTEFDALIEQHDVKGGDAK